jgi:NAD(P)-dependent dehydrogenase (short-subunit alcohol dehydrogenase family)
MDQEGDKMEKIEGKVILVTGGARGLGAAICQNLCEAGATVIPADIRADLLEETARKIQADGLHVKPLQLDVCDEHQVQRSIQQIVDEFGRFDVLVNNAGTDKTISVEELEISDWDRVMAVNLRGPFVTSKYAFPVMRQQGSGAIVNIVSTAAKRAWANAAAYHASKWGLLGLSHALHVEARQHNIKVTAIVAGGMRTPFLLDRFPDIDLNNLQDPASVAQTVRFVLTQPAETVIPEVMVLPMRETSWP